MLFGYPTPPNMWWQNSPSHEAIQCLVEARNLLSQPPLLPDYGHVTQALPIKSERHESLSVVEAIMAKVALHTQFSETAVASSYGLSSMNSYWDLIRAAGGHYFVINMGQSSMEQINSVTQGRLIPLTLEKQRWEVWCKQDTYFGNFVRPHWEEWPRKEQ